MSATGSKGKGERRSARKAGATASTRVISNKIETVTQLLEQRIRDKEWEANQPLPTQGQLSEEYGVSLGTIAIAFRNLQKRRVVNIVANKGVYVLDSEEAQRSGAVPLIALRGSYVGSVGGNGRALVGGVLEVANAKRCQLLLLPRSADGEDYDVSFYRARGVQGVIFLGGEGYQEALSLRTEGFPVILANEPASGTPLNFVNYDHGEALRRIVNLFADMGHERIAVVFPETSLPGYFEKILPDFLAALGERHLLRKDSLDYWKCLPMKDLEEARKTAQGLFAAAEPPTAIFALTSSTAAICIAAAKETGRQVPEDLSIAASCFVSEAEASFSGFVLPCAEVGESLFEGICETIENPFHHVQKLLPLTLVDRHTIAPRRKKK